MGRTIILAAVLLAACGPVSDPYVWECESDGDTLGTSACDRSERQDPAARVDPEAASTVYRECVRACVSSGGERAACLQDCPEPPVMGH